jgi:cytochrome oxidase Cu insertion factor (SCO1/SenC/PrrC family)
MPGMGTGLSADNPTIVAAFHSALFNQALVVLLIVLIVATAGNVLRWAELRQSHQANFAVTPRRASAYREPPARRLLRISFGFIWIFDGLLQGQASMPLGMAPQVIRPAAAVSPGWVQHLDNALATIWSYHPIAAPAAAVWIQVGLGVWLLAAARGDISRLAGLASLAWGLVVWIFGEAFGQIFAPGLTWMFGAPGAVLFYCLAGALVALPTSWWATPRLGRLVVRAMGLLLVGAALLQAWPGRGFWQGKGRPGAVAGQLVRMLDQMAQTPQPHLLASWLRTFAGFDSAHGWAVNLFVVVALAVVGTAFLTARRRVVRGALLAAVVLCLADWTLVQDLGFLGGLGTDPNSMVPMALVLVAGYLAITRPATVTEPVTELVSGAGAAGERPAAAAWCRRVWPALTADPTYAFRSIAAAGAIGVTLVGCVPMLLAATSANADPVLSQAIDGTPDATNSPAPSFTLVDQWGQTVSLTSLRGRAIALTFLDPVCTSDCPVIAQEFMAADKMLGASGQRTELVAVDANPRYTTPDYLVAFDRQENLESLSNWLYLTGSLRQLERVWDAFGVQVAYEAEGGMIAHSDIAYVINQRGYTRYVLDADPGPATSATRSSFAAVLASALDNALRSGR